MYRDLEAIVLCIGTLRQAPNYTEYDCLPPDRSTKMFGYFAGTEAGYGGI